MTAKEWNGKLKKEDKTLKINDQYETYKLPPNTLLRQKRNAFLSRVLFFVKIYTDEIQGLKGFIYVKHQKLQFAYKS
jgi:hypothetical protein